MATVMEVASLVLSLLTPDERAHCVAYALDDAVPAGTTIAAAPIPVIAPSAAYIAFIDREPLANWGHAARYLIVDKKTATVTAVDARFPPFRAGNASKWHVIYRAPGVPDTAVAAPR